MSCQKLGSDQKHRSPKLRASQAIETPARVFEASKILHVADIQFRRVMGSEEEIQNAFLRSRLDKSFKLRRKLGNMIIIYHGARSSQRRGASSPQFLLWKLLCFYSTRKSDSRQGAVSTRNISLVPNNHRPCDISWSENLLRFATQRPTIHRPSWLSFSEEELFNGI